MNDRSRGARVPRHPAEVQQPAGLVAHDPRVVPGGMWNTSPGPNSSSLPSWSTTFIRPSSTYPVCSTWQLSVPDRGLTCTDQRQPGSNVPNPTVLPDSSTSSSLPLPSLNGLTSSGDSNRLAYRIDI
jgi:hypothetical protein